MAITADRIIDLARRHKNTRIIHLKSGRDYRVIGLLMFKIDDTWHNSIHYYDDVSDSNYSRKFEDFKGFNEAPTSN